MYIYIFIYISFLEHNKGSGELKSYNSYNKAKKEEGSQAKERRHGTSMVDSLKKLQDDMINNYDPKMFNEIANLVKSKCDFPIENLNLKNPEHLKLIE